VTLTYWNNNLIKKRQKTNKLEILQFSLSMRFLDLHKNHFRGFDDRTATTSLEFTLSDDLFKLDLVVGVFAAHQCCCMNQHIPMFPTHDK
jgi:hypothetical protein